MKHVPLEIYEKIFLHTSPESIYLSSLVCHDWRSIITHSKVILLHALSLLAISQIPSHENRSSIEVEEIRRRFFQAARNALFAAWISTIPTHYSFSNESSVIDEETRRLLEAQVGNFVFKGASGNYAEPPFLIIPNEDRIHQLLYSTNDEIYDDFQPLISVDTPGKRISQKARGHQGQSSDDTEAASHIKLLASARGPVLAALQADGSISILKKGTTERVYLKGCVWSLQEPLDMVVKTSGNVAVLFKDTLVLVLGDAAKPQLQNQPSNSGGRKPVHRVSLEGLPPIARLEYARRDMQLLLYPAHSPVHSHYTYSADPPYRFAEARADRFMDNAFPFHDTVTSEQTSRVLKIGTPFDYQHETDSEQRMCIFSFLATAIDSTTGEFVIVRGEKVKLEISCDHSIDLDEGRATLIWMIVARIGGVTESDLLAGGNRATGFEISGASAVVPKPTSGGFKSIAFGSGKSVYVTRVDVGDLLSYETSIEGVKRAPSTVRELSWQKFEFGGEVRRLVWTSGYVLTAFCDDGIRRLDFRKRIGTKW